MNEISGFEIGGHRVEFSPPARSGSVHPAIAQALVGFAPPSSAVFDSLREPEEEQEDRELRVSDRVRSYVYVLGRAQPMHVGIVTRDHGDGTYDVDRMSLHGGAPWVVRESSSHLRREAA